MQLEQKRKSREITIKWSDGRIEKKLFQYKIGDIVKYKYFSGKGERLFKINKIDKKGVHTTAINGYTGTKHIFDWETVPLKERGIQKVASGLELVSEDIIK